MITMDETTVCNILPRQAKAKLGHTCMKSGSTDTVIIPIALQEHVYR